MHKIPERRSVENEYVPVFGQSLDHMGGHFYNEYFASAKEDHANFIFVDLSLSQGSRTPTATN